MESPAGKVVLEGVKVKSGQNCHLMTYLLSTVEVLVEVNP